MPQYALAKLSGFNKAALFREKNQWVGSMVFFLF